MTVGKEKGKKERKPEEEKEEITTQRDGTTEVVQGFAPATKRTILQVPLPDCWSPGLRITDAETNQVVYKVLEHERMGRTRGGDPLFLVLIGNEHDQAAAVVLREIDYLHMKDQYVIFSVTPNYEGQVPFKGKYFDMYQLATLEQSPLGNTYQLVSYENRRKVLLRATNPGICWTLLCCTMCFLSGCFKWELAFYEPGAGPRDKSVVRHQQKERVTVEPGASPLLAVCLAYALDRLTIPAC